MKDRKYITIGYRHGHRTALNELSEIEVPLKEGRNKWLSYSKEPGESAYSWISIQGTDFEVYSLDRAVREALVVHCPGAKWVAGGKPYQGDAYFPKDWIPPQSKDGIPSSVAAQAPGFLWGRVETNNGKRHQPKECVGFFILSSLKPALVEAAGNQKSTITPALPAAFLNESVSDNFNPQTFDPSKLTLGKETQNRAIAVRRGQAAFRMGLLSIYGARCCISGETCDDVLEAAHIVPYDGEGTNHPQNGLLLRCDLHTLFDRNLLSVEPDTHRIVLAPSMAKSSYRSWHGKILTLPKGQGPSRKALKIHFEQLKP